MRDLIVDAAWPKKALLISALADGVLASGRLGSVGGGILHLVFCSTLGIWH